MNKGFDISTETTGFSSPAETYVKGRLDTNELLVPNPIHTFFMKASGNMDGVRDGDILVIDRSLEPKLGDKVVLFKSGRLELKGYSGESEIWGVLTFSIRGHR